MVVAWLAIGSLLLLFELHHLAFYALFGTVGCVAGAVVALFLPSAVALQVGVGAGVALAGVVAVRPFVSKAFGSRHTGHVARGVHGGLIGEPAIALDPVGYNHVVGHVRLSGERWLAVSGGGGTISAGTPVVVVAIEGTTLVVWPVDEATGSPAHTVWPDAGDPPDDRDRRTS